MRAIVGVTEFKAEFAGMLDLHERFNYTLLYQNLDPNLSFIDILFQQRLSRTFSGLL